MIVYCKIIQALTRSVIKNPFWTSAPSTLLHSCDMPDLRAIKLFTFNSAHVFGDVNETNVCKYIANVRLSECVSLKNNNSKVTSNKVIRFRLLISKLTGL